MDLVCLFKCMMGLYDLDLSSTYLVTADCYNYNLRHANLFTSSKLDMQEPSKIVELVTFYI